MLPPEVTDSMKELIESGPIDYGQPIDGVPIGEPVNPSLPMEVPPVEPARPRFLPPDTDGTPPGLPSVNNQRPLSTSRRQRPGLANR